MLQVKDIQSSTKIFSTNTNCKTPKPKIFLFAKVYTPKVETEKKKQRIHHFFSIKNQCVL